MTHSALLGAGLILGVLVYPTAYGQQPASALALDGQEPCATTVYGQCVYPDQPQEEIATMCQSEYGCEIIVDIGSGTVTYVQNPAPASTAEPSPVVGPGASAEPTEAPSTPAPCEPGS